MAFAFSETPPDPRGEDRLGVRILATLTWREIEQGVVIDNLSSRGALLRGANLPEAGTEVVLRAADCESVATVAWSTGPNCGLTFHRAIDADAWRARSRVTPRPASVTRQPHRRLAD